MATARELLVDPAITPFYHCISRCVRRAFLISQGNTHRKQWIEDRLQELVKIFAIDVCGYSILDDHIHVLLRLDHEKASAWSALEIARRWFELCPPKDRHRKPLPVTKAWIAEHTQDLEWIEGCRKRLTDLGWFMKSLKEQIARKANQEDNCTGVFWEGRFRTVGILDEASLLAICAFIDLKPFAAGNATTPATSTHSSLKARIDHCEATGKLDALLGGSPHASKVNVEKGQWLFPIEDRRDKNGKGPVGMFHGITLSGYLQLIDWSSHLIRPSKTHSGKVSPSANVPETLTRRQIDASSWKATLEKLLGTTKYVGTYFGSTARLNEAAAQRGIKFIKNVTGRETPLTSPPAD